MAEQMGLVDNTIRFGAFASTLAVPLFGYALFRTQWPALFWAWALANAMVAGSVLFLSRRWRCARPAPDHVQPWAYAFTGISMLMGGMWGSTALLFYLPTPETIAVLLVTVVAVQMSAGAGASAYLPVAYANNLALTVPFVWRSATGGTAFTVVAAFTGAFTLFVVGGHAHKLNRVIVGTIRTRLENRDLNAALTAQRVHERTRVLEAASRHKSEFLANMSHELRTPLNAIIGYSEMLQEDAVDQGAPALVPDLLKITSSGKHLLELINAVLDLSKIEAGKLELHVEELDLPAVVGEIESIVAPLAARNGNRFELVCESDVGRMRADVTKLRQVLINLVGNACKFTERGRIVLRVVRERVGDAAWLCFSVADTGIGMTSDQLGRLFEDFMQAEAWTSQKYGGTGLGLALSRRLCRLMGGDLTVTSEAGRGSTFTARLPSGIGIETGAFGTTAEAAGDLGAPAGTVLVIDDEADARDLVQRILVKEGFRVLTATSGEQGLRLAREVRPDVITLDVMMPGLDGWSVLGALEADPVLSDIPVIMLTMIDEKKTGYALGAADYLTKPVDRARLVASVGKYRRDLPVLVVDGNEAMRREFGRILQTEGYTVIETANSQEALRSMAERVPGAILLDVLMPDMDGFEFVAALSAQPIWRSIPVFITTAQELTPHQRALLNGSIVRILQKGGFGQDQLLADVRAWVGASVGKRRGV